MLLGVALAIGAGVGAVALDCEESHPARRSRGAALVSTKTGKPRRIISCSTGTGRTGQRRIGHGN